MRRRAAGLIVLIALGGALTACSGGGGAKSTPTAPGAAATSQALSAQRPKWFPASFPLPAGTTVVKDQPADGGGGTVQFRAPVTVDRMVQVLDLNLASHDYTVAEKTATADAATYSVKSSDFAGDVKLSADGANTLVDVTLKPAGAS